MSSLLRRPSFADCALRHRSRAARVIADPNNLFHRGALLSESHDDVLREIALLLHRKGNLDVLCDRLLDLAADALLLVDAIDGAGDHVGALLIPPASQAA